MGNGVDFKAMAIDLRSQLEACEKSKADLLEALESCAGWLEWLDDPRCGFGKERKAFIKQARAAIARVRGEA